MNSKVYKWCAVPHCKNTSLATPNKVFVYVPNKKIIRDKWLKLARRNPNAVVTNSSLYFCEDHFDLPNDMENYMQYHVMGSVSQVRMIPGCMPSKFICQTDRITRTSDTKERPYIAKKRRMMIIQEAEKYYEEESIITEQSSSEGIASSSSGSEEQKLGAEGAGQLRARSRRIKDPKGPTSRTKGGPGGRRLRELLIKQSSTEQSASPSSASPTPSTSQQPSGSQRYNNFVKTEEEDDPPDSEDVDVKPFELVMVKEEVEDTAYAEEADEELYDHITIKEELEDIPDDVLNVEEEDNFGPFEHITVKKEMEDVLNAKT